MEPSDRPEFLRFITDVLAFFRQPASEFALEVWWSACAPFTMEQLRSAITAHATDAEYGRFAPKPADVVRTLAGTHSDRAQLAWGKTHEAMSAVGAYRDVVFDDPAIHAVVQDLGGWVKLCRMEQKELGFAQHRFCQAHQAYTSRGDFAYPRLLMGERSCDDEYLKKGLEPPTPALVGDKDRAQQVLRGGNIGGKTQITFEPQKHLPNQFMGIDGGLQ
jgi:hypothetical protein